MLLYLCRHAQTASSAVDSFNGRRELPLTEHGREQARRLRERPAGGRAGGLGERLAPVEFAAVFRSPLGRTAQTAALVAPGREAIVLDGLTEIDYGAWEGLAPGQARALDPARYNAWEEDPARTAPPAGETAEQVAERVLSAITEISMLF